LINKYLESEPRATSLKAHVGDFRALKLNEESDLELKRIEFHHDEQGWRRDLLTYNTFEEVADYLSREVSLQLYASLYLLQLTLFCLDSFVAPSSAPVSAHSTHHCGLSSSLILVNEAFSH
jgi:hypothetical protein